MTLKETEEPYYNNSCFKLLHLTWACIAVVFFVDAMTILIETRLLGNGLLYLELVDYVFRPGIYIIAIIFATQILSTILLRKGKHTFQAIIYIVSVVAICYIFAKSNQNLSISLVIFAVPIMLSIAYLNKKILVLAFILTLLACAIQILTLVSDSRKMLADTLFPINVEVSLLIFIIVFAIGMTIIEKHELLHKSIAMKLDKKHADALTGYMNHSGFYDDLDDVFMNCNREKGEFSLALIDIDNFTHINDKFGHNAGDDVIEIMADTLNKYLVNSAQVYRYGGEEFVMICKGEAEVVINMMDSILREFRNKTEMKIGVAVTASSGICEYDPGHFTGKRDIFAAVDEALYVAKRLGKNQYAVWNEALVRDSFISIGRIELDDVLDKMTGTD